METKQVNRVCGALCWVLQACWKTPSSFATTCIQVCSNQQDNHSDATDMQAKTEQIDVQLVANVADSMDLNSTSAMTAQDAVLSAYGATTQNLQQAQGQHATNHASLVTQGWFAVADQTSLMYCSSLSRCTGHEAALLGSLIHCNTIMMCKTNT